jgi:hypothetical protein
MGAKKSIWARLTWFLFAAVILTVTGLLLSLRVLVAGSTPSAPTAVVSGVIRHAGNPVSGVTVSVSWSGGGDSSTTGPSGAYSVSGVPTGGWIRLFVRPPVSAHLAFRNWTTSPLTGDLTKDFDLEEGQRLQGAFHLPGGAPYSRTFWLETEPSGASPLPGEWYGVTAVNGQFDVVLPRGIYTLNTNPVPMPYYMPYTKLDLRTSDVTGLVIELLDAQPAPFPTTPPRASLITIGTSDLDGNATVTGAAGAVEPLSAVMIVNLSSRNIITATADLTGAFEAVLYAPPGSSLMVKYDRDGERVEQIWQDAFEVTKPDITYLSVLPGAVLYAGPPSTAPSYQEFDAVGSFVNKPDNPSEWAGWAIDGELYLPPGTHVSGGDTVSFYTQLRITSPAIHCVDPVTYTPRLYLRLRYLFDSEGHSHPWGAWFTAHLFTPTGLPIEHEAAGDFVPLVTVNFEEMYCISEHTIEGTSGGSFTVPSSLSPGTYLLEAYVDRGGVPRTTDLPLVPVWNHNGPLAPLPPITIGEPAPPRIPWTLLADYPINGHRGLQAREDVGHFDMPTRVVYPPNRVVVPRLDRRTMETLVYRLEPGSNWMSGTDRRLPNPPRIPLDLPSGSLTVEVHKPDGSTDVLGSALVRQSSARTPTLPDGTYLDFGTGHVGDIYHLATMDEAFEYRFEQDGDHTIVLEGHVQDVYGNLYPIDVTYDVTVANILDLDPAQLPTTPYVRGGAFAPGLHVFPPVPAEVSVTLVQMPYSDPSLAFTTTVTGVANRFGYFQPPPGAAITMEAPGEFRVDITAIFDGGDDGLWMGTMTWGGVIEGPEPQIVAHGRRGMDHSDDTLYDMPIWFDRAYIEAHPEKKGIEVYYPYFSGDVHWGDETPGEKIGDSIHSIITVEDPPGGVDIYGIMQSHFPRAKNCYRFPPEGCTATGFISRTLIDEAPLFITTQSGIDPGVAPEEVDLWGYWYASSERPDVRVRELVSEDGMGTAYWRFDDTYGYQIGEPADGDQPGDIKWEFGGAVFRVVSETSPINEYAIYSSLWVLLPHGDPTGLRITAPFRGANGTTIDGGPILTMTVEGAVREIDVLFLPKGVRPGDVLEVGDTVSFSGHVGPPLDSRVEVAIISPSGVPHHAVLRANKIGWVYDPGFDFPVGEPGRWTVDVFVEHDRPLAYAAAPTSHNTGTVMGTLGRYEFYVVEPGSPRLFLMSPEPGFITWPRGEIEPIHVRGFAPPETEAVCYTIHDKGVVMGQGTVIPESSGAFTVTYDAVALHENFSMLSLTAHEGEREGLADEVTINLLAVGGELRGTTVTLIGEEVFVDSAVRRIYLPLTLRE